MTTMPDAKPGPSATLSAPIQAAIAEVGRRIVGQEAMVERLMVGLLTGGHILLEGVPGLAKTLAVRTLAEIIQASFSRIQFTPDLLPADVVGTMVFDVKTQEFGVKKGPIFANILLADEINRAPAKVQSALLEAMQERQVTIGGHSYRLEEPFLVLATQNPIESEGTYPLPEAQLDRFLLKVHVGYPTRSDEKDILLRMSGGVGIAVEPRLTPAYLLEARRAVLGVVELAPVVQPPVGDLEGDHRIDHQGRERRHGEAPVQPDDHHRHGQEQFQEGGTQAEDQAADQEVGGARAPVDDPRQGSCLFGLVEVERQRQRVAKTLDRRPRHGRL
jgi:hypothetical protein